MFSSSLDSTDSLQCFPYQERQFRYSDSLVASLPSNALRFEGNSVFWWKRQAALAVWVKEATSKERETKATAPGTEIFLSCLWWMTFSNCSERSEPFHSSPPVKPGPLLKTTQNLTPESPSNVQESAYKAEQLTMALRRCGGRVRGWQNQNYKPRLWSQAYRSQQ